MHLVYRQISIFASGRATLDFRQESWPKILLFAKSRKSAIFEIRRKQFFFFERMLNFYIIFIPLFTDHAILGNGVNAVTVDKIVTDKIETFAADCKEKLIEITTASDTICTPQVYAGLQDSVCHSKDCGFSDG